jgi:Tol biopolymer transport system component
VEWNNHVGQDETVDDKDVRWNKWRDVVDEPEKPLEPETRPCPPFMGNDPQPQPADVPEYFFVDDTSADKLVAGPPVDWAPGETKTYTVKIKNMGAQPWKTSENIRLGVHFDTSGDCPHGEWDTNQTFALERDVPVGDSTMLTVEVKGPDQPRGYTLCHRLLSGDSTWFEQIHESKVRVMGILRASIGSGGEEANGASCCGVSLAAERLAVAFTSAASNLVPGDTNNQEDVFVRRLTCCFRASTIRVSVGQNGVEANNDSGSPSISADGTRVAFHSFASNLVSDDTDDNADIFVRDLLTGQTTRVSVGAKGQANDGSLGTSISADGNRVAFRSSASNLVDDDDEYSHAWDVFVRDLNTKKTFRVSVGETGEADDGSFEFAISADGKRVAFTSFVSHDTFWTQDLFVRDLDRGQTIPVYVGAALGDGSSEPAISADGSRVAFKSGTFDGGYRVFVRDLDRGQTIPVSVSTSGVEANNDSGSPSISADGGLVAFDSAASNLVPGDTNNTRDIFVRDLTNRRTTRVSVAAGGQANDESFSTSISADGGLVAFTSAASNLVPGDTNGVLDVFGVWLPDQ